MCERCNAAQTIIKEWLNQQGHNRCWYYPDLFKELVALFKIESDKHPQLPPLEEFKLGCERYQKEEYGSQKIAIM